MSIVRLLHGLGADRRAFQRFERLLPSEWSIEALDLLGHGDAPHPERGYSLDHHAAYIAERIAADAPLVLVGHSYGAATSVAVAALYPQLVRAIVLLDPIVSIDIARRSVGTDRMIEARRSGTLAATVDAMYPDQSRALRAWTVSTWEAMALGVVDELDVDWTRFADRVTCPVSIIHGELELGGGGDLAADWFDDPVVMQVNGAGHYLHATHAREVAELVVEAVTRVSAADS